MSSATEANNTVLRSTVQRAATGQDHIVTCATEHPSVLESLDELRESGVRTTVLPVERDGRVDPERFAASLDRRTLLASIMWANNETGVVQLIPELARIAAERGVRFHTDAVQALGKLPVSLGALPIDFASFSAHKLGGPKGHRCALHQPRDSLHAAAAGRTAGAKSTRRNRERAGNRRLRGGVHCGGRRHGGALGPPGRAARSTMGRDPGEDPRCALELACEFPSAHAQRLVRGAPMGEALVEALDVEEIAVASGAACHSGSTEPSHVLLAMGVPVDLGAGSIRFSLGPESRADEIEHVIDILPGLVERVRRATRAERATRQSQRR